ncbi:glycosyltransferase family 4 protein [Butyricimonas paravirosa]
MRLLYIADNGFSYHNGVYYYTRPNEINSLQYLKYFENISYIARSSVYKGNEIPINEVCNVRLVGRYSIRGLKNAMYEMQCNYDVVIVRNGLLGCFAVKYAKRLGKTLIAYCGADPFEFQKSRGTILGFVIAYYWRGLERKKMLMADYAHYCTKVLYDRYPCHCPYLICSNVNIQVDNDALVKRFTKIKAIHKEYTIGLIGQYRNNDNKGISTVIRALALLGDKYRFQVVGDGDPKRYKRLINKLGLEDRIDFLGYISNKKKLDEWLDDVDFYVQPSLSEGLPRAMIEAMARACPVIGTDVCGTKELLDENYLIKCKDYKALVFKIREMSTLSRLQKAAKMNFNKAKNYSAQIRDKKLDDFFSCID